MLTGSNTPVLFLSQTVRTSKRSEAGLILPVPHSLICSPVFGRGVKYRCAQRAGSTRQWCDRFCSTVEKRGQYGRPFERISEVFDNDSIRRILHMRHRDCVLTAKLQYHIPLISIPAQLVGRRLRLFGHAARRPDGEPIKGLLLPTPPRTWYRRTGGQLKTWETMIKADLKPLYGPQVFGYARWRNDWLKVSNELAQDRRAWGASVRDVVNSVGDAGSTRPG